VLNIRQHNASFKSSAVSFKRMLGATPIDKGPCGLNKRLRIATSGASWYNVARPVANQEEDVLIGFEDLIDRRPLGSGIHEWAIDMQTGRERFGVMRLRKASAAAASEGCTNGSPRSA
jgi:hypothetical protein